jgi:hypothetical protein
MREQPRLLALGLGGHGTPLARMLARLKWNGVTVPLLARLVKPGRALRELAPMRRTATRRAAANALAFTGSAWAGQRLLEGARRWRAPARRRGFVAERVETFGSWADDVWLNTRDHYTFAAARDAAMLNVALPMKLSDTHCVRVRANGVDAGWACLVRHDFSSGAPDPNFGRLTVGLIADAVARPADAAGVLDAAIGALIDLGVDLMFTNQLHPAWIAACRDRGFIAGPSNFAYYRSPAAIALTSADVAGHHMNRGDCDGPIWYGAR